MRDCKDFYEEEDELRVFVKESEDLLNEIIITI